MILEAIDIACQPWGYQAADILLKVQRDYDYKLYEFEEDGYLKEHIIREHYPATSNCNFLAAPREKIQLLESLLNN